MDELVPFEIVSVLSALWPSALTEAQAQQLGTYMAAQAMQEDPEDG